MNGWIVSGGSGISTFCDDTSSKLSRIFIFIYDHYAHINFVVTTYRHKMKNGNPKKKSTV